MTLDPYDRSSRYLLRRKARALLACGRYGWRSTQARSAGAGPATPSLWARVACHSSRKRPQIPFGARYLAGRVLNLLAVGKLPGMGSVTRPVAAHSVPRPRVVMKPTQ